MKVAVTDSTATQMTLSVLAALHGDEFHDLCNDTMVGRSASHIYHLGSCSKNDKTCRSFCAAM